MISDKTKILLSEEQQEIIRISKKLLPNDILKINACAGSGKTTTLREIALENSNKHFLYLAFNKAIVEEIKEKMPNNVDVKTIHSLAYAFTKKHFGDFKIVPKLRIFDVERFFADRHNVLFELLEKFNSFLKSNLPLNHSLVDKNTRLLFQLTIEKELPFTHNFYLKYYALSKEKNLSEKYDIIMLDEAQDTNSAMLEVFLDNSCAKILVGDTFQNIYGFNETINALEIVQENFSCNLTVSFRSRQCILDYANGIMNAFSLKQQLPMQSSSAKEIIEPKSKAFITRTNSGIIKLIKYIVEKDLPLERFGLIKEPDSIFEMIFALEDFEKGFKLPHNFSCLNRFKSVDKIRAYAKESQDHELLNATELFMLYPITYLKKLFAVAKFLYDNKKATNFITNAHQSKGLEWDSVELFYDFPRFLDICIFDLDKKLYWNPQKAKLFDWQEFYSALQQELNLFYVASTRAKYILKDNSRNKNALEFIKKHNINIREHLKRRKQGDFTLAFKDDRKAEKENEKKDFVIEFI